MPRYSSPESLDGWPVIARKDNYLGGGFVAKVKGETLVFI